MTGKAVFTRAIPRLPSFAVELPDRWRIAAIHSAFSVADSAVAPPNHKEITDTTDVSSQRNAFIEEIKNLYDAEQQLSKALPKMAKAAYQFRPAHHRRSSS